jgi:hypothetical protein
MQTNATTTTCQKLLRKLKTEQQKEECYQLIGGEHPHEVTNNANALINKATQAEIIATLQKVESIKGKSYSTIRIEGTQPIPYAGIPATFLAATATKEELAIWYDQIIKNSYSNGTKYQPLPSHDEAWQTLFRVRTEQTARRYAATQWLCTLSATPSMSDDEIIQAAHWGFWGDCTITIKRRLFLLMPDADQRRIRTQNLGTTRSLQAVHDYYNPQTTAL